MTPQLRLTKLKRRLLTLKRHLLSQLKPFLSSLLKDFKPFLKSLFQYIKTKLSLLQPVLKDTKEKLSTLWQNSTKNLTKNQKTALNAAIVVVPALLSHPPIPPSRPSSQTLKIRPLPLPSQKRKLQSPYW